MSRTCIFLILGVCIVFHSFSQSSLKVIEEGVNINDNGSETVTSGTVLDVKSDSKGVIFPRLTTQQRDAIVDPQEGTLIYNLDFSVYQYWNSREWTNFGVMGKPPVYVAPDNLLLEAFSDVQINLSWINTVDDYSICIYRSAEPDFETGSSNLVATIEKGSTSYSDIVLNAETQYYYRIGYVGASIYAEGNSTTPYAITLVTNRNSTDQTSYLRFSNIATSEIEWLMPDGSKVTGQNYWNTQNATNPSGFDGTNKSIKVLIFNHLNGEITTSVELQRGKIVGSVDLSRITLTGVVSLSENPQLTSYSLSQNENTNEVTLFKAYSISVTSHPISKLLNVREYWFGNNDDAVSIDFPAYVNLPVDVRFAMFVKGPDGFNNGSEEMMGLTEFDLTGFHVPLKRFDWQVNASNNSINSLDFSSFTEIKGSIQLYGQPAGLTTFIPPSVPASVGAEFFILGLPNLDGVVDFSWARGGFLAIQDNPLIDAIIYPQVLTSSSGFNCFNNSSLISLDISNLILSGHIQLTYNSNLSSIVWPSTPITNASINCYGNNPQMAFQDYKLGTILRNNSIEIGANNMNQAQVDANIDQLYLNRTSFSSSEKYFGIGSGNATPSGSYQAPSGFVLGIEDGIPANPFEKIYVLVNNYNWKIRINQGGINVDYD